MSCLSYFLGNRYSNSCGRHGCLIFGMLSKMCIGCILFLSMLMPIQAIGQGVDSSVFIVIDPFAFNYSDRMEVYKDVFNQSIKKEKYEVVNFVQNDNIYDIMRSKYKFYDVSVATEIARFNDDIQPTKIRAGEAVLFPLMPSQPASTSSYNFVQQIDFGKNDGAIEVIRRQDLGKTPDTYNTMKLEPSNARLWSLKFPNRSEALKFISDSKASRAELSKRYLVLENEPTQLSYLIPEDTLDSFGQLMANEQMDMSYLNESDFGFLYVLDELDKSGCAHGNKVKDVIRSTLEKYKVNSVGNKIKYLPINFFENRDTALLLLKKFYEQLPQAQRELKEKNLPKLSSSLKKCKSCMPEEFISSLFRYCYSFKDIDVISTSFVVSSYSFDIVPPIPTSNKVMFVASSTNESYVKIEDRFRVQAYGYQAPKYEPLYTYFMNKDAAGVIVTALENTGNVYGMTSTDGSGVTVLGNGDGWTGTCISKEMIGTSFATPQIAAMLFIFKAYLRKKEVDFSPLEIKKRLILSSDLRPELVGRVGSAGLPSLRKLTVLSKGYAVDLSDEVIPMSSSSGSYLVNSDGEQIKIGRSTRNEKRICGIQFNAGKTFVFFEDELTWRPMDIQSIHLSTTIEGQKVILNEIELINKYKQIVILNN